MKLFNMSKIAGASAIALSLTIMPSGAPAFAQVEAPVESETVAPGEEFEDAGQQFEQGLEETGAAAEQNIDAATEAARMEVAESAAVLDQRIDEIEARSNWGWLGLLGLIGLFGLAGRKHHDTRVEYRDTTTPTPHTGYRS